MRCLALYRCRLRCCSSNLALRFALKAKSNRSPRNAIASTARRQPEHGAANRNGTT